MHGYVYIIIKNNESTFSNEDIEEIASDVFLTIWKNKEKLDINKEIAPYIAGITRNLILKKKRKVKGNVEDIEDLQNYLYKEIDVTHKQIEENEKINILNN